MECECGNENMIHIFSDHNTGYYDIYWCNECGRLLEFDEDNILGYTPKNAKEVTNETDTDKR